MKRNNAEVNSIANVIVIGEASDCFEYTDEILPYAHLILLPVKNRHGGIHHYFDQADA